MIKLKELIKEGKWELTDQDDETWYWRYNPSFFQWLNQKFKNLFTTKSEKMPKIREITARLDNFFGRGKYNATLELEIIFENPITIYNENPPFPEPDSYEYFDRIVVDSHMPFTSFSYHKFMKNEKNIQKLDHTELNKIIRQLVQELKPELLNLTKYVSDFNN